MERKELKNYSSDHIRCVENNCENDDPCFWSTFYIQHEADAVMDAMELQHKADAELIAADRRNMEQMKNRINVLEKLSEVTDRMLQDMASNNNREFLPDSNKELGTELGTQLGTDQVAEAGKMVWVSVKDRLPLYEGTVLVCDANNGLFALLGREPNGVLTQLDDRPTVVATHWMPLPNPPTISKTENVATAEESSDAGGDNA